MRSHQPAMHNPQNKRLWLARSFPINCSLLRYLSIKLKVKEYPASSEVSSLIKTCRHVHTILIKEICFGTALLYPLPVISDIA